MSKKCARYRESAYLRQFRRCFYCNVRMWLRNRIEFMREVGVTVRQARQLMCSTEHLRARQDGGTDDPSNIVAACTYCNRRRHACRKPLSWRQFLRLVRRRLTERRWHDATLLANSKLWR